LPVTSGFEIVLGSTAASVTMVGLSFRIAEAQRPGTRSVSFSSSPQRALNQMRSSSTIVTEAIGVWRMRAARVAMRSKAASGGVSSTA